MVRLLLLINLLMGGIAMEAAAQEKFETDVIKTSAGNLEVTFIGHGTLMFKFGGKVIHVDPWTQLADYTKLPQADLILITHEHRDHLDLKSLEILRTGKTVVVCPKITAAQVPGATVMNNGDPKTVEGLKVKAVPAYNLIHKRDSGQPFHPKSDGNGYIITFGDKSVYVAGDTENIPEMKQLKDIDVAFLPMNLPYTMTPEMVADAAKSFQPKVLYPCHYGETDASKLAPLLKDTQGIEVRIRRLK
jgi:L-ascorbate metabolism protein UlaG (beta-lactamase superfamily)